MGTPVDRDPPDPTPAGLPDPGARLFTPATYRHVLRCAALFRIPSRYRQEFAQLVFKEALKTLSSFDPSRRPEPWLLRIARNQASHFLEKAYNKNELPHSPEWFELSERSESVPPISAEDLDRERDKALLLEALAELEPHLRDVLLDYEVRGLPIRDIATKRGIPESTAYHQRAAAWKELEATVHRLRARRGDFRMMPIVLPPEALAFFNPDEPAAGVADAAFDDARRAFESTAEALDPPVHAAAKTGARKGRSAFVSQRGGATLGLVFLLGAGTDAAVRSLLHTAFQFPLTAMEAPPAANEARAARPVSEASPATPEPVPSPAEPAPVPPARAPSPPGDSRLAAEESWIMLATQALEHDDHDAAQRALDKHARIYPHGRFAPQREQLLQRLHEAEEKAQSTARP